MPNILEYYDSLNIYVNSLLINYYGNGEFKCLTDAILVIDMAMDKVRQILDKWNGQGWEKLWIGTTNHA
jgi:hypothetical protein